MTFDEKIAALIQRLPKLIDHLETEEATKNALIMPFIAALGYDIFNPQEVVPEFVADVGIKRGEKVDYAIMHNEEVILLFECKKVGVDLSQAEMSQLYRYFSVTKARISVLTNGVQYRFFSDLEESNKMDARPFLELDLENPKSSILQEVKKLAKEDFDLEEILSTANELKYTSAIKKILAEQYEIPHEEFVRFFFDKVNPGSRFVTSAKEQFTPIVTKAFNQFISERVSDRLLTALQSESIGSKNETESTQEEEVLEDSNNEIITTEEEIEAFRIIQAIARKTVPLERVVYRDAKTYMSVILDDNNRKPICRLWFNSSKKYLGTFDYNKSETKNPIDSLSNIYDYSDQILSAIQTYIA